MMPLLKGHAKTKSTSLPWVEDVPQHWELRRIKTVLKERVEKGYPSEPLLAATQSKGVVRKEDYENRTVLALKDLHLLKLVRKGDFVISLRSFQGGIEFAREQGIISPAYTILHTVDDRMHGYLAWLFKSAPFIENLTLNVTGIRQGQNIDYDRLSRDRLPIPPLDEQTAIVRFLDHADRKIRRYIRAKQKLVKLLEEQKQAIIHRAVTRGLDPNVKLKPSGVEWLGDVPEHWEVTSLRYRYYQVLGKMLDSKRILGTHLIPYLRNTDIQWGRINVDDLPKMDISPDEYERYTVRFGDLLVCEGGEVGRSAIWTGKLAICGFQKALHRLRPIDHSKDLAEFAYYVLLVASSVGAFDDGHISTIGHLTGDKLRAHRFAFPKVDEQARIVDYLKARIEHIQLVVTKTQSDIELSREFRTRLISDVVTGKLDVREAAARLSDMEDATDAPDDAEFDASLDDESDETEVDAMDGEEA